MTVFRQKSDRGDTSGLGLKVGDHYECVDCGKKLKVMEQDKAHLPSALHTWQLDNGTVVSICGTDWKKRRGTGVS